MQKPAALVSWQCKKRSAVSRPPAWLCHGCRSVYEFFSSYVFVYLNYWAWLTLIHTFRDRILGCVIICPFTFCGFTEIDNWKTNLMRINASAFQNQHRALLTSSIHVLTRSSSLKSIIPLLTNN